MAEGMGYLLGGGGQGSVGPDATLSGGVAVQGGVHPGAGRGGAAGGAAG